MNRMVATRGKQCKKEREGKRSEEGRVEGTRIIEDEFPSLLADRGGCANGGVG